MIGFAAKADLGALKNLYRACFADPEEYIDAFFAFAMEKYPPAVYRVGDSIAAMAFMLPAPVQLGKGTEKGIYFYALATRPDFQGRGIMSELMTWCENYQREQGVLFTTLVPGSESLFRFYEKRGYLTDFYARICHVAAMPVCTAEFPTLTAKALFARRQAHFAGRELTLFRGEESISFSLAVAAEGGGFALDLGALVPGGYAVGLESEEKRVIRELGVKEGAFSTVFPHLGSKTGEKPLDIWLPDDYTMDRPCERRPFGMSKFIGETKDRARLSFATRLCRDAGNAPYMAFMFD